MVSILNLNIPLLALLPHMLNFPQPSYASGLGPRTIRQLHLEESIYYTLDTEPSRNLESTGFQERSGKHNIASAVTRIVQNTIKRGNHSQFVDIIIKR